MYCIYCGTKTPDDAVFCNKCGRRLPVIEPVLKNQPASINENSNAATNEDEKQESNPLSIQEDTSSNATNGAENVRTENKKSEDYSRPDYNNSNNVAIPDDLKGMKWHSFNIYFALWVWMLFILSFAWVFARLIITNAWISNDPINILICILIVFAILAHTYFLFLTRKSLANFEERGPNRLIISFVITIIMMMALHGSTPNDRFYLFIALFFLLMLLLNMYYYKKRAEYFKN